MDYQTKQTGTFVMTLVLSIWFGTMVLTRIKDGRVHFRNSWTKWLTCTVKSTPVISKSKSLSEILRDIRTSTNQICKIEGKIRTTTFHKSICNLTPEDRDTLKILWKREEIAPEEQLLPFFTIFWYVLLDFHAKTGTRVSLRDKRLFEISKAEITRVDCICDRTHYGATQSKPQSWGLFFSEHQSSSEKGSTLKGNTVNPLYTDTRYNDNIP